MNFFRLNIPLVLYLAHGLFCAYFIIVASSIGLSRHFQVYCLLAVLLVSALTFIKRVPRRLQAFSLAHTLLLLAVIYGFEHGDIGSIQGTFLAIVCLTSLYEDELLSIAQMLFIAGAYVYAIIFYPDLTFSSLVRKEDLLVKLVTLNLGQLVLILRIMRSNKMIGEITQRTQDAEAANKSKSDFLANMSHEIRTPMNAIVGMTEFILRDEVNDKVRSRASNIQNASNSLLTIINDILDFSKIEAGKLEIKAVPYYLASMINEVSALMLVRLGEKPIEFIVKVAADLPTELFGDEIRLKQVITNLLNNAVKFTSQGSITLTITNQILLTATQSRLDFSITDTGMGIKADDLQKLFSSFSQVDTKRNRSIEGTGLGLAICKNLCELMGGKIAVASEYGQGSTFSFYLPQTVLDAQPMGDWRQAPREKPATVINFTAPMARVLIVDDNMINLLVAQGQLEPFGMQVTTALSAEECFTILTTERFAMIFMDHMMPIMDGIEATEKIRQTDTTTPIIALTANALSGAREMYLAHGFTDFLAKPIEVAALAQLLQNYLPENLIVNRETR